MIMINMPRNQWFVSINSFLPGINKISHQNCTLFIVLIQSNYNLDDFSVFGGKSMQMEAFYVTLF